MSKQPAINPSSFSDAIKEGRYGRKSSKRKKLVRARKDLVHWLRKKGANTDKALALADKLEECRRKHRCKSGACPECVEAARRLFTETLRRYLKSKSNVACITIVPADGIAKKGSLS
ncbi:MAG TPA: hypothetical protein VGJ26_21460 [Pirellulales bacterium]|jgi:hypothetical protein